MPLNVKLLREIQKHILSHPKTFLMHTYIYRKEYEGSTFEDDAGKYIKFESCGTAGCIAGWAVLLREKKNDVKLINSEEIRRKAIQLLGIENDSAYNLFGICGWGEELAQAYDEAPSAQCRAIVAAKAIDNYIEWHKSKKYIFKG